MHTALICINLLGDSLYLLKPVQAYIEKHPEETVSIIVEDNPANALAGELFDAQFPGRVYRSLAVAENVARDSGDEFKSILLQSGTAATVAFDEADGILHISKGYARLLDVEVDDITPPSEWHTPMNPEKEYALLAPFSKSCTSHAGGRPNKTIENWKWQHIIRFLQKHKYTSIKVLGGKNDRMTAVTIPETDYLFASSLVELQVMLKKAHLVISLDNGIAHMASALAVDTIVMWPKVSSIDLLAPIFSPRTAIMEIGDPVVVQPVQLLDGIKRMMRGLENRDNTDLR